MEDRGTATRLNTCGDYLDHLQTADPDCLPFGEPAFEKELTDNSLNLSGIAINLLMMLGSWFAMSFFMGFLALTHLFESEAGVLTLGIVFTAAALFAPRPLGKEQADKFAPIILSVLLVGEALLIAGVYMFVEDPNISFRKTAVTLALVILVVQSALLFLSPSSVQKFISAVAIPLCLQAIIYHLDIRPATHFLTGGTALIMAFLWGKETEILAKFPRSANYYSPVSVGLTIGVGLVLCMTVNRELYEKMIPYWWLSTVLIAAALLYIVREMLVSYGAEKMQWMAFVGVAAAIAPTVLSPGIAFGIFLLVLSFWRGHKMMFSLGVIAFGYFVFMFYYNLQTTLLNKSMILLGAGALFLLIRYVLSKFYAQNRSL